VKVACIESLNNGKVVVECCNARLSWFECDLSARRLASMRSPPAGMGWVGPLTSKSEAKVDSYSQLP
jgi:hypothetical protein